MEQNAFERLPEAKRNAILSAGIAEFGRKPYANASTDAITAACGISKGLLFHYFGSKKAFYLYCLEKSLEKLVLEPPEAERGDFYHILFCAMDYKFRLCVTYPDEMHLVNMASRDAAPEVAQGKGEVLRAYVARGRAESKRTLERALAALPAGTGLSPLAAEGLALYINAVMNKYLLFYQEDPDAFFKNAEQVKAEMRAYLSLMLHGICGEGRHE